MLYCYKMYRLLIKLFDFDLIAYKIETRRIMTCLKIYKGNY